MRKLIATVFTAVVLFSVNVSNVLADGNPYGPYKPYEPHKPIPTGFEDTTIFFIAALVTFTLGMSLLSVVKTMKAKQSI